MALTCRYHIYREDRVKDSIHNPAMRMPQHKCSTHRVAQAIKMYNSSIRTQHTQCREPQNISYPDSIDNDTAVNRLRYRPLTGQPLRPHSDRAYRLHSRGTDNLTDYDASYNISSYDYRHITWSDVQAGGP